MESNHLYLIYPSDSAGRALDGPPTLVPLRLSGTWLLHRGSLCEIIPDAWPSSWALLDPESLFWEEVRWPMRVARTEVGAPKELCLKSGGTPLKNWPHGAQSS